MQVNRALLRFVILVLALAFGVFYGIDLAQKGIEQVHGPIAQSQQSGDGAARGGGQAEGTQQPNGRAQMEERGESQGEDEGEGQGQSGLGGQPEVIDYRDMPSPGQQQRGAGKDSSTLGTLFRHAGAAIHYVADGIIRFIVKIGESVLD